MITQYIVSVTHSMTRRDTSKDLREALAKGHLAILSITLGHETLVIMQKTE